MEFLLLLSLVLFLSVLIFIELKQILTKYLVSRKPVSEIDKDILAYQYSISDVDGVVGSKFVVGDNCRDNGLAIMLSCVNLYGLGPGVYPLGKSPLPSKKLKLCYEVVVFDDEVSTEDKKGKQTRLAWLKSASSDMQLTVLRSNEKYQKLLDGKLKEKDLL